MNLHQLAKIRDRRVARSSSWDRSGRNTDCVYIEPGQSQVLADINGPGLITHIWLANPGQARECLLRFTWDDAKSPSVHVPVGDFFCLGHGIVNSFQSLLFSASTRFNNQFEERCALNCYVPMPFRERAVLELVNEGRETHRTWFYVDYETGDEISRELSYFHAEFRRANPFRGWGPEITVNVPEANIANKGELAWENNYLILETRGRGHYIGCNLSVTNFKGEWWGEGDDMIWVDGYKWPPDLHGTGSEDYLNQAWGMQPNAFLRNGSSIHESETNGYQTSYVFHIENPIRFQKEIKVTIEHGHGNHLANEMASVAYWFADQPTEVVSPPPVTQRLAVLRDNWGNWLQKRENQSPGPGVRLTSEMKRMKSRWASKEK